MKKIYETIFGLVSSLVIFLSPAEGKKITNVSNDYYIPDIPKISSLDQVELVPVPLRIPGHSGHPIRSNPDTYSI